MGSKSACKSLVLDAGPLLSLSPLRGLALRYVTVPQVLSELKDKNAREHFERLALTTGVKVEVLEPDATSISQVIQFAKKTGDYSVLSYADICVLALTLALDAAEKAEKDISSSLESDNAARAPDSEAAVQANTVEKEGAAAAEHPVAETVHDSHVANLTEGLDGLHVSSKPEELQELATENSNVLVEGGEEKSHEEPLDVVLERIGNDTSEISTESTTEPSEPSTRDSNQPLYEDPSDEDDGEGEWITPANVDMYKTLALDLLPSSDSSDPFTVIGSKSKGKKGRKPKADADTSINMEEQIAVGCMTADFAMQNVLLQMGLSLVGTEGKRIQKVKTWVLRCHACFKICKDSTKKFCPSCGNPTLLRTTVTAKAPTADDSTPALEVHLKKNFVYRTRGTVYSIPKAKPGSAKTGSGEGLVLREDQTMYMRAMKREEGRREREERKILKQSVQAASAGQTPGIKLGNWLDPDWLPEMLTAGAGGKGRHVSDSRVPLGPDGLPVIGYGRKNPNERRRKR